VTMEGYINVSQRPDGRAWAVKTIIPVGRHLETFRVGQNLRVLHQEARAPTFLPVERQFYGPVRVPEPIKTTSRRRPHLTENTAFQPVRSRKKMVA